MLPHSYPIWGLVAGELGGRLEILLRCKNSYDVAMICIVDYGTGNLASIANMLKKIGQTSVITSDAGIIAKARKLILPGVGSFDTGMGNLRRLGLLEILDRKALEERVQVLGICLGAQLLMDGSEEGVLPGLGWISGKVIRFRTAQGEKPFKVPHMSWNFVEPQKPSRLFDGMYDDPRFYFVHSYHFSPDDRQDVLTETVYGYTFASSIEKENIAGVQFHPEKSHKYGMKLLQNFAEIG